MEVTNIRSWFRTFTVPRRYGRENESNAIETLNSLLETEGRQVRSRFLEQMVILVLKLSWWWWTIIKLGGNIGLAIHLNRASLSRRSHFMQLINSKISRSRLAVSLSTLRKVYLKNTFPILRREKGNRKYFSSWEAKLWIKIETFVHVC